MPSGIRTGTSEPTSTEIRPFPDDVMVLLTVQVISCCRFAGKISLLGARWECSSGLSRRASRWRKNPATWVRGQAIHGI